MRPRARSIWPIPWPDASACAEIDPSSPADLASRTRPVLHYILRYRTNWIFSTAGISWRWRRSRRRREEVWTFRHERLRRLGAVGTLQEALAYLPAAGEIHRLRRGKSSTLLMTSTALAVVKQSVPNAPTACLRAYAHICTRAMLVDILTVLLI